MTHIQVCEARAHALVRGALALFESGAFKDAAQVAAVAYGMAPQPDGVTEVDYSVYELALSVYEVARKKGGLTHDDIK